MRILLVEDDTEISDMLKNFLMTENFEVVTVHDGESARRFVKKKYLTPLLFCSKIHKVEKVCR